MENDIIVTIRSLVYNHEPYIRQCLDGFVMQKTNFRFEAIVHDDASTDGTADIIREYAEKYPDIIKPILETENQYSKHDGSLARIMNEHTHGKYVALCEGDDYWTDPYKLQKQVDFLESHPDYSLCFHNAIVHYENSNEADHIFSDFKEGDIERRDLISNWIAPTASFVFRKDILYSDLYSKVKTSNKLVYGDLPLIITASYIGKIYGFDRIMSVYRKQPQGAMNILKDIPYKLCLHDIEMTRIFGEDLRSLMKDRIGKYSSIAFSLIIKHRFSYGFKLWKLSFSFNPIFCLKYTFLYPINLFRWSKK